LIDSLKGNGACCAARVTINIGIGINIVTGIVLTNHIDGCISTCNLETEVDGLAGCYVGIVAFCFDRIDVTVLRNDVSIPDVHHISRDPELY